MYTTSICYLLLEYTDVQFIATVNTQPYTEYTAMLSITKTIVNDGYAKLSLSFRTAFPSLTYKADIARQKVLDAFSVYLV